MRARYLLPTGRAILTCLSFGALAAVGSVPAGTLIEFASQRGYRAGGLPGRLQTQSVAVDSWSTGGPTLCEFKHLGGCLVEVHAIQPGTIPAIAEKTAISTGESMEVAWAGYPFDAAVGWSLSSSGATHGLSQWTLADPAAPRLLLPWRPIWHGLFGNALVYASPLLLGTMAFGTVKLQRRVARGCCMACGYELGDGVIVCPECGLAAKAQRAQ